MSSRRAGRSWHEYPGKPAEPVQVPDRVLDITGPEFHQPGHRPGYDCALPLGSGPLDGRSSDALPDIEFQVLDVNRNVLYDNRKSDYSRVWDFKLESSQQLIISLRVMNSEIESEELLSGCVAIMFGIKEDKE